jgi:predicted outer membrane protein
MTTPRFEPRSFCQVPENFGRFPLKWMVLPASNEEANDQLGAAKIQHEVAWRMRSAIAGSEHRTVQKYARAVGADPTRMGRMLRGTIVMRVEDMISAQRHLGIPIWSPALAPPSERIRAAQTSEVPADFDATSRSD